MKSQKQKLKEEIELSLLNEKLNLTEHQAHVAANIGAEIGQQMLISSNSEFAIMNMNLTTEYEQNRLKFREQVEFLQKETDKLMNELKKLGMVYFEKNPKNNKIELKARSTAMVGIVKFLNALEEQVLDFYQNVYKIEPDGKTQMSLFPNDV